MIPPIISGIMLNSDACDKCGHRKDRSCDALYSAGHTTETMDAYYLTYGWRKEDMKEMKDEIIGWGEA